MIKLLWIVCSAFVFVYSIKAIIKDELDTYGGIDGMTMMMIVLFSFMIALGGPLVIVMYLVYTVMEGIADNINKEYYEKNNR